MSPLPTEIIEMVNYLETWGYVFDDRYGFELSVLKNKTTYQGQRVLYKSIDEQSGKVVVDLTHLKRTLIQFIEHDFLSYGQTTTIHYWNGHNIYQHYFSYKENEAFTEVRSKSMGGGVVSHPMKVPHLRWSVCFYAPDYTGHLSVSNAPVLQVWANLETLPRAMHLFYQRMVLDSEISLFSAIDKPYKYSDVVNMVNALNVNDGKGGNGGKDAND